MPALLPTAEVQRETAHHTEAERGAHRAAARVPGQPPAQGWQGRTDELPPEGRPRGTGGTLVVGVAVGEERVLVLLFVEPGRPLLLLRVAQGLPGAEVGVVASYASTAGASHASTRISSPRIRPSMNESARLRGASPGSRRVPIACRQEKTARRPSTVRDAAVDRRKRWACGLPSAWRWCGGTAPRSPAP
jgi:hypothetical protein